MKVQIISYKKKNEGTFSGITVSTLANPKSLDEYDINIIDLTSTEGLWSNNGNEYSSINSIKDFASISSMVTNSKKTNIVYIFPRNISFSYWYSSYDRKFNSHILLKDCLGTICKKILNRVLPTMTEREFLAFENTRTTITGKEYEADFYFGREEVGITKSNLSEKITTIKFMERIYGTTLGILNSKEDLLNYLKFVFEKKEKSEVPEWVHNITFSNDEEQKNKIKQSEELIEEAQNRIIEANEILDKNMRYKSILYTNSDELVEVVFEILEKILDCDLSGFEDIKKEDFLIKMDNVTFIGEIKGVTSNIKYENISQVELHYRGYLDRLEENGQNENVKQILIMNPFRTKSLDKREPVCEDQIKLAVRNGCLIIETNTLLRIFEKFCNQEITIQQCVDVFSQKVGLLSLDDFA